jgi:hypothetical protein
MLFNSLDFVGFFVIDTSLFFIYILVLLYVSNIFADTMGLSCFNAGREQTNVLYTNVIANAILKKHTPKLYVIRSPYYVEKFTTSPSLQQFLPILKKYNVPFLDYSFDTAFTKQEYFYDNVHLTDAVAYFFSARL